MEHATYTIHTLALGHMANFVYLIHDHASERMAVVDPAWDVPQILAAATQCGAQITDILVTHSHFDHTQSVDELQMRCNGAAVHVLREEAVFWGRAPVDAILHADGDRILLGQTTIDVLHTPGHSPGSACYLVDQHVITGDTLFIFGCGRCDLRGSDPVQMYQSLHRLATLPADTIVCPGHDYAVVSHSTIAEQITGNPFFYCESSEAFVDYRLHGHHRTTPYHAESR